MGLPYSKRIKPLADTLRYDIPPSVRNRIIYWFRESVGSEQAMHNLLVFTAKRCRLHYGGYRHNGYCSSDPAEAAHNHFVSCTDEEVLDFIEWCFQSPSYEWGRWGQTGVDVINSIFRQEGIGYEFSPCIERQASDGTVYPEAIKKTNELLHQEVVRPTLQLLSDPRFKTANDEMMNAHKQFRDADFEAAINACGQAFESVLKTICDLKTWSYDPNKDTLAKLVEICRANGLFPEFYTEIFKNSGTIRNKLGSHGKGPTPPHGQTQAEHAEHMIHKTSAHILLLARLANG